jgi:hypothetical protein
MIILIDLIILSILLHKHDAVILSEITPDSMKSINISNNFIKFDQLEPVLSAHQTQLSPLQSY